MPNHSLTYYNVVKEVLTRVNDKDGDTYLDRAKELVFEGISALSMGEYPREGYPSLVLSEHISVDEMSVAYRINVAGSSNELSNDVMKIISITDDYINQEALGKIKEQRYIQINTQKYNRLNDPDERPFDDEIYFYHQGNYLYFYPHTTMTNQNILVHYIASPEEYTYSFGLTTDGTGSTELTGLFSLDFLYKVVDYGTIKIRAEQSGE